MRSCNWVLGGGLLYDLVGTGEFFLGTVGGGKVDF